MNWLWALILIAGGIAVCRGIYLGMKARDEREDPNRRIHREQQRALKRHHRMMRKRAQLPALTGHGEAGGSVERHGWASEPKPIEGENDDQEA